MYIYAALILYRLASLPWKAPSQVKPLTPTIHQPLAHRPIIRSPIIPRRPVVKSVQKTPTMRRPRQDMTITTNSPVQQTFLLSATPTTTTFHITSPTLPPFSGCQNFLLSATPSLSSKSSCEDSPILPPSPPLPLFQHRRLSTPTSTLPAYPTPRSFYGDSMNPSSSIFAHSSTSSNLSTAETAVEGRLALQATRLSDILPNDLDFYAGEHEELLNVDIEPDVAVEQSEQSEQGESISVQDENVDELVLGPEIQGVLPVINGQDFDYYPPPSHYVPPSQQLLRERVNKEMIRRPSHKLTKKNRGDGSGGGFRILWRKIQRKVKKMRRS